MTYGDLALYVCVQGDDELHLPVVIAHPFRGFTQVCRALPVPSAEVTGERTGPESKPPRAFPLVCEPRLQCGLSAVNTLALVQRYLDTVGDLKAQLDAAAAS